MLRQSFQSKMMTATAGEEIPAGSHTPEVGLFPSPSEIFTRRILTALEISAGDISS